TLTFYTLSLHDALPIFVCIASSNGRITLENRSLNDIHTPVGIPIIRHTMTATVIIAIVDIISSHNPKVPIKNTKKPYNTPEKKDLKYHVIKTMISINSHHGNHTKKSSIPLIMDEDIVKIKSKKLSKVRSIHPTRLST